MESSHTVERDMGPAAVPTVGVAEFITFLAKTHGVHYAPTPGDALAEVITKLADDEVRMDKVELLILALERAGVIASEAVVPLHINYLREKFGSMYLTKRSGPFR